MINFKQKYFKYKSKYLKLVGGEIYYEDETIDNKLLIIIETPYNPESDIFLAQMRRINININSKVNNEHVSNITKDIQTLKWCLNPNNIYINNNRQYFLNRYNFILYSVNNNPANLQHIIINDIPDDVPYYFSMYGIFFGQVIDLFNCIYSYSIINKVCYKIIEWLIPKTHALQIEPTSTIPKFYLNIHHISRHQIYFYNLEFRTIPIDINFKVHMNIKLEYLFYILNILLDNYILLKPYLQQFKIDIDFSLYRLCNQYSNRAEFMYKMKQDGSGIINEEEQPINIAFYPRRDDEFNPHNESNNVQRNVREIINILIDLFPNDSELSSNLFPRMNFKLTDCIYFAIGDSGEKFNHPENYMAPLDYIVPDELKEETNRKTKILSNHILYEYNDQTNEWIDLPVTQYQLLNKRIFENYTSRDIYKMIGHEDIYDNLIEL